MKIRKKNVKLSQKLSAGMAVIIGAGLLVAYIFVHLVVFDVVNEDALESAFSYRLSHARLIDAWLAEQANTVRNLAEALPLVDNKNFQYIMSHYYGIHGYAESVWVVFADNTYYNSALVDLGDDVNFTEQSWWALAEAADGDVVFTSPYASHVRDGDIIVTVARYMHNLVGQPAVVGMSISLEHLSEIISNYGRQTETRLILVGIYGEIIIHPSREYMPAPGGVPTLMRHIEAYACVYEQMRLGEYIFRCDYHEDNLYYMQFPLASTGWTLVSEIPRAIALAPVWDTIIIVSLAIVFVLGLVAVFMFVFFSRVFIRPIAILTKDVSELTAGNHDVRIANTMRNDEIGTLSKAIRTTFRKIQYTQEIQRERIQRIVDAAPMCVTCYDTTFMMFDCNEAALRMFGIKTKEEFVNAFRERFFDFFPEVQPCGKTTAELAKISFEQAAKTGRCSVLVDHITADGEPLATDVMLSRIEYADTFMIVCYVHDLREEKKARDERRRREVAEETDRAKSRFLARMSHEIRTPITAVLGIAEIELQNLGMPPQLEESLVKIHTSADMLLGIVNDVLDLSKIESDKMELIEEEYETASMINDVTQLHPAYLCSKNIAFHLTVDQNLPQHLFGDCLRIKQILSNLLSNAFKYTESGRVDLEWRSDGTTLLISLRDTGMGMTREQIDLLSGEYLRFHENENRVIGGTGLGMPIVFSLIRLMNGEILIDSEPGVGTHLQLRIPQKPGKTSGEIGKDLAERLQKFESDTRALGKRFSFVPEPMPYGSVLVVDDVSENIYVIRGLLAFYDLRVDVCKSGPEAIERVKSGKTYDVIFMDHMMPVMTGIEAMKKIRETGYKNPIVALTANALV
ncbi:MAG: ATP-binding protein, partial [Defluviitaleaceae bacterium]|nr:ATP-binding protein [Defluviitaleaceae bacterium]